MLESVVEIYFAKRIRERGGFSIKLAPTEKGIPDRLAILPGGRVYLVELKAPGGEISLAQTLWHAKAGDRGVRVYVVVGVAGVDEFIIETAESDTPRG